MKGKEETPITAEDLRVMYAEETGNIIFPQGIAINADKYIKWLEKIVLKREQYAQAKVLEALEIVKTLTDHNVSITSEHIDNLIRSKTKV